MSESAGVADDVVETLFELETGEAVKLRARYYEWATAFTVDDITEHVWHAAVEWRTREIRLVPDSGGNAPGRVGKARDVIAVEGGAVPEIGQYGPLVEVERVDPPAVGSERPEWLARDAPEIVETSPVDRTLTEVLAAAERQDSVIDIHKRLASPRVKATSNLLFELGLCGPDMRLADDEELAERVARLREVYVDD